ncbi:hypothetical protein BHM03_00012682 [Ensete ventricosum]|nr:hypothetical protein BHM03_00012682 [Ensete ventricosum]
MRLEHDWTDDGREMRLEHDWPDDGREMRLGHDWTNSGREVRLGHDWTDDGREMRLGHDWTNGGREVHLRHDWTNGDQGCASRTHTGMLHMTSTREFRPPWVACTRTRVPAYRVLVFPYASSEGTRSGGLETNVSGSSYSGIPSPEDIRSRRDLEWSYQPGPSEISISVDALEAGLHFPLHPTIVECLR